jgi:hypothetical protein
VTYWVPSKLTYAWINDIKEYYWVKCGQGHNLPSMSSCSATSTCCSPGSPATGSSTRRNTNKHSAYREINITPNIYTKYTVIIYTLNKILGTGIIIFGVIEFKLCFFKGFMCFK